MKKTLADFQGDIEMGKAVVHYHARNDAYTYVWQDWAKKFIFETDSGVLGFDAFFDMIKVLGSGYVEPSWELLEDEPRPCVCVGLGQPCGGHPF